RGGVGPTPCASGPWRPCGRSPDQERFYPPRDLLQVAVVGLGRRLLGLGALAGADALDRAGRAQLDAQAFRVELDVLAVSQALKLRLALEEDVVVLPVDGQALAGAVQVGAGDLHLPLGVEAAARCLDRQLRAGDPELDLFADAGLQLRPALDDFHAQ